MDYLSIIHNNEFLAEKLESFCDFHLKASLCKLDKEYMYSNSTFIVFGTDSSEGEFGFIGDGDISELSIGYLSPDGETGRIAKNLSEFFHLIVFYPFWHDLCYKDYTSSKKKVKSFEESYIEEMAELDIAYHEVQNYISDILQLNADTYHLSNFYIALTQEPKFIIYSVDEDCTSTNLL